MPTQTAPLISIIIPVRNEKDYIVACLESILSQQGVKGGFEIIVVEGMSTDGTETIIEEQFAAIPQVKLIFNSQGIVPCALNLGIRAARGKIIIRLDAHNVYPSNYISALVSWLEKSGADNVGGLAITKPSKETPKAQAIALGLAHPFGVGNAYFRIGSSEPKWVDTVPFGCYRREVFDKIGMFDEDLVRNQDDEFNLRLIKNGGKILLVPEIISHYYARDSLIKLWRMYWQYGYFKPLVVKKIKGILTVRQTIPTLFILSLLITVITGWFFPLATNAFVGISASYLAANLFFSIRAARRFDLKTKLWLCMTFPVIHFSYGFGYLRGIIDFWLCRKRQVNNLKGLPISR